LEELIPVAGRVEMGKTQRVEYFVYNCDLFRGAPGSQHNLLEVEIHVAKFSGLFPFVAGRGLLGLLAFAEL
jgi:hypothetical protein